MGQNMGQANLSEFWDTRLPSNSSIYYHLADANKMKETINDSFGIPDFFLPVAPINGSGYQEPPTSKYSIPHSPCGERPHGSRQAPGSSHFNPRSPCGERPNRIERLTFPTVISIHAPRVGSDLTGGGLQTIVKQFQSTLPVWGSDILYF